MERIERGPGVAYSRRRKLSRWLPNGIVPICLAVLVVLIGLVVAAFWRALQMMA